MNKKGFAISIVLYVIIFLIIAIFYVLLAIVKTRYNVSSDLRKSIEDDLNSTPYIYDSLETVNQLNGS